MHSYDNSRNDWIYESTLRGRLFQGIFDFFGIAITFTAFALVYNFLNPRIAYLTCDQSDLSYPNLNDSVPIYAVIIYGVLGPIVIVALIEFYNAKLFPLQNTDLSARLRLRQFFIAIFHFLSFFVFGIGIILLLNDIGKRWTGRLRPYFVSVCQPGNLTNSCQINSLYRSIYTGGSFCTGSATLIKEARMSFPSRHTTFAVYTMLFLVIYLQYRLVSLRFRAIRTLIQLAAVCAAWITALSRVIDYKVRGSDAIGGAILGGLVAILFAHWIGESYFSKEKYETDFDQVKKENEAITNF